MYSPTQAEVEAKAAEMFGETWKSERQHKQAVLDGEIADFLDIARRAVQAERSDSRQHFQCMDYYPFATDTFATDTGNQHFHDCPWWTDGVCTCPERTDYDVTAPTGTDTTADLLALVANLDRRVVALEVLHAFSLGKKHV